MAARPLPLRHHRLRLQRLRPRAADELIAEEHSETSHEELYVVLAGEARFTLDGDEVAAPAGTLVHCPPPVVPKAVATEPGTTVLAVGAIPGQAYAVAR